MLAGKKRRAAGVFALAAIAAAALALPGGGREAVISVAGDILLDRGVADFIAENGLDYPYGGVSALFCSDDLTVANLECPLTLSEGGAMKGKEFVFKADPANAAALKAAGFDVLTLANNHTMDYLSGGLTDTMAALSSAGLGYAGAGESADDIQPFFIEKNGVRIGILGYSSLPPEGFMYDPDSATVAYARAGYLEDMKRGIAEARARCDFLLVCFHWGTEFRHDANDLQIEIARAAADAGASAVVGAHPHVLQGRERYNGVPIYYSVGNFVFDKQIPEGTDKALIVQFTVGRDGLVSVKEIPVVIGSCRPRLADGEEAAGIEADLDRYSRRFESGETG